MYATRSIWQGQAVCQVSAYRNSIYCGVVRICAYHKLFIICTKKCFRGFWRWTCETTVFYPKKALYPAWIRRLVTLALGAGYKYSYVLTCLLNTRLLVYHRLKSVQRPKRYVSGKILHTKKEIKKNWVVTLATWGSNTLRDLDQMWHVSIYGTSNHAPNIWWLSVKGCEFDERGKFALSDRLEVSSLQRCSVNIIQRQITRKQVYSGVCFEIKFSAGTEGSTVSSLICDCWLILGSETLSISRCLNHW